MVGITEDLFRATTVHVEHKLRTGSEPGAEGRVLQIGLGLVEGCNGELLGCCAVAKPGDLRKDKPDPVTRLSPGSQLSEDRVIDGRLGGEETVEIVKVRHKLSTVKHILSRTISCLTILDCKT